MNNVTINHLLINQIHDNGLVETADFYNFSISASKFAAILCGSMEWNTLSSAAFFFYSGQI
jgi:hypothetical protein